MQCGRCSPLCRAGDAARLARPGQNRSGRRGVEPAPHPVVERLGVPELGMPRCGRRRQSERGRGIRLAAACSADQVQLLRPTAPERPADAPEPDKLLVYFPGMDGTGNAILPQLERLQAAGFDIWSLYIATADRSSWEELTAAALALVRRQLAALPGHSQVTLVAESFGCCLALRCAAAEPALFQRAVLVNPATAFARSWGGLLSLIAATNLLSVFPEQLFQVAQAVLAPLLVDRTRVGRLGLRAVQQMMAMDPPPNLRAEAGGAAVAGSGRGAWAALETHAPSAGASWRLSLLQRGDLPDDALARIRVPVLLVSSARDRLLDSLAEGARLQRALPLSQRRILPASGHTALLEGDIDLARLMADAGFLPPRMRQLQQPAAAAATPGRSSNGTEARGAGSRPLARVSVRRSPNPAASTAPAELPPPHSGSAVSPPAPGAAASSGLAPTGSASSDSGAAGPAPPAGAAASASARSQQGSGAAPAGEPRRALWGQHSPALERLTALYAPLREVVAPVVRGAEHLPAATQTARPLLLVGNHARVGLYDLPFLMIELYLRGIQVRGLAHPGHWRGPLGPVFQSFGAVKASPMAAFKLLRAGEAVLLFPGGAREVNKRRGEEYRLFWSPEPDFVRLAAKLDALVIPFAAVGGDDAFGLALDSEELLRAPLLGPATRAAFARFGPELDLAEAVPPLTTLPLSGLPSPVPVPNLSRLYFRFMEPMDMREAGDVLGEPEVTRAVYAEVRARVEAGLRELRAERQADPKAGLPARLMDQLTSVFPAFDLLRF